MIVRSTMSAMNIRSAMTTLSAINIRSAMTTLSAVNKYQVSNYYDHNLSYQFITHQDIGKKAFD